MVSSEKKTRKGEKKTKSNDTVLKNKSKKFKHMSVVVNIPQSAKDCDSNWKKLMTEISTEKTAGRNENIKKFNRKIYKNHEKNTTIVDETKTKPDIWFDDIPEEDILSAEQDLNGTNEGKQAKGSTDALLVKRNASSGLTKTVGIDCEMVGTGFKGSHSALARVSVVNQYGKRIYDKHVKSREKVTDYRTWVSGIRPSDLKGAEEFEVVQREVAEILKGRILVGHALHNDLKVLYLTHPKKLIRDTSEYKPFRSFNNGRTPALRVLSSRILGVQVQKGEHSSVQDAQAAMKLYMMHKKQWEKELRLLRTGKQ